MTLWERRMIEILRGIAAHAEALHDRSRSTVRHRGERHDFRESEGSKPVAKRQSGGLRCITVSPMIEGQTPPDFHAWREGRAEPCPCQSGKPDERGHNRDLDCPQTKAVFAEVFLDAINQR